jgi:4-hydroxybenzoate polyprenyltransferase
MPFVELARFDRPVGIPIIVYPFLYGFLFAVLTRNPVPGPSYILSFRLPLLLVSGTLLRALGCVWNDIIDIDFDRQVKRTRHRPLARGAISVVVAGNFFGWLLVAWIIALLPLFPDRQRLVIYMVPLLSMVIIYPFMKRATHFPQAFLGITLGWGVLMGAAMADTDPLGDMSCTWRQDCRQTVSDPQVRGLFTLYGCYILWTLIYDTVYAFQDVKDDLNAGVKSMAVRLNRHPRSCLLLLAAVKSAGLGSAGYDLAQATSGYQQHFLGTLMTIWPYTVVTMIIGSCSLGIMIAKVDLQDPRSCGFWFKAGSILVGSSTALGLGLLYLLQAWEHEPNVSKSTP